MKSDSKCVAGLWPSEFRLTKSHILRLIFMQLGVPLFAWDILETRYKNKFTLRNIRDSFMCLRDFSFDFYGFTASLVNTDPLLLDEHAQTAQNLFWARLTKYDDYKA